MSHQSPITPELLSRVAALPPQTQNPALDLQRHREFIARIGRVLSGEQMLGDDEAFVYVYRTPSMNSLSWYPALASRSYGQLSLREGHVMVGDRRVVTLSAEHALEFLTSLMHRVSQERRELSLALNHRMEASGRSYPSPGGAEGHLLKEYDLLLDDIRHEYHYHRRGLGAD